MPPHVIIIPGAKTKYVPGFNWLIDSFYEFFGVKTNNRDRAWVEPFKKFLESAGNIPVSVFDWPGGVSHFAVTRAAKRLRQDILSAGRTTPLVIFAKSLGGNVASLACHGLPSGHPVAKIIYVATPHQTKLYPLPSHLSEANPSHEHITLINVQSDADRYVDFAGKALYLGFGDKQPPQLTTIILPGIRHYEFMENVKTEYENQPIRTFDLFKKLIEE
ncbi:MAG: hypothetical protein V1668_04640 [Patescibacteria group bacterium]